MPLTANSGAAEQQQLSALPEYACIGIIGLERDSFALDAGNMGCQWRQS
jgi:hypothetical protein